MSPPPVWTPVQDVFCGTTWHPSFVVDDLLFLRLTGNNLAGMVWYEMVMMVMMKVMVDNDDGYGDSYDKQWWWWWYGWDIGDNSGSNGDAVSWNIRLF